MKNTDTAQDAENLGKIEKGVEDLISQSRDELTEELEKEAGIQLRRQMQSARQEISRDIADDMGDNIYQNQPQKGMPLTLDDKKKNVKDRSIRQINPEHLTETEKRPDQIYQPEGESKQQTPQDMFDDLEDTKAQQEAEKKYSKNENKNEEKKDKEKEKEKTDKKKNLPKVDQPPAKKTNEESFNQDKTPEWMKQEPSTSEGGMARADTGDLSQQKKKEKPKTEEESPQQQEQRGREMDRDKRRARKIQQRKEQKEKREQEAQTQEKTKEAKIGKMSPLAFILWLFLAVICDICSLIPYVGLIFSWPFAIAFGIYKWKIKIKKELALATTALDFVMEGLLSTLPVNIIDVILTFVLSNSSTVRKVTKKISSTTSGK